MASRLMRSKSASRLCLRVVSHLWRPRSAATCLHTSLRLTPAPLQLPAAPHRCLGSSSATSMATSGPSASATQGSAQHVAAHSASTDAPPPHLLRSRTNFCRVCGSPMSLTQLQQAQHGHAAEWRHVCTDPSCGFIEYHNPRMVVGCIVEHEGRILLCRRGIEPCKGLWTVPAGFMELAESSADGAARETREEACAEVSIHAPYAHWDIPVIGQAYILFRGTLAAPFTHAPGPESLETALFAPQDVPFDRIAFSSVALSLKLFIEDMQAGTWRVHHGVVAKQPGSSPNDPASFRVEHIMQLPLAAPVETLSP